MLTLEAAVDNLDADMRPLVKELFMSTPNLTKDSKGGDARKISTISPMRQATPSSVYAAAHIRQNSYNMSAAQRKAVVSSPPALETRG